jgi:putative transposase
VRELAADGIPVAVSCRVLKLSRQPYYRWLAAPVPEAEVNEAYRANALFDAHQDDPEFGYRYLADEAEIAGEPMAVRTAWRLCSDNAWFSAFGYRRPVPCQERLTDIRASPDEGKPAVSRRPVRRLTVDALEMAVARRGGGVAGCDADGRTRHEFRRRGR